MSCGCAKYGSIELFREKISERIGQTRTLRRTLEIISEHPVEKHKLLKCFVCDQYWQLSYAWNWGDRAYLFKVPEIEPEEWLTEPYVQPAELLIHSAAMENYMSRNRFVETRNNCRTNECTNRAIKYSVFCLDHRIESLQIAGALPRRPYGRELPEYNRGTEVGRK